MKVIDVHAHAFPDALAPRAIAALEAECPWKAFGDGTVASLIESMDAAGVEASVVCAIATKSGQEAGILSWCETIRSERVIPFPSVHPASDDRDAWVERFAEAGFKGVKIHPMYQACPIDDPAWNDVYAACRDAGLLVTSHCGYDIAYPADDDRAAPRRTADVLDRFEGLRLIATHMGGWQDWDEVERRLVGRELLMETSFIVDGVGPERAVEIIRSHGVERTLFGTDYPWRSQEDDVRAHLKLDLTDAEREKVLHANARRELSLA